MFNICTCLINMPENCTAEEKSVQTIREKVEWCAFTVDGKEFFTATEGWLRLVVIYPVGHFLPK